MNYLVPRLIEVLACSKRKTEVKASCDHLEFFSQSTCPTQSSSPLCRLKSNAMQIFLRSKPHCILRHSSQVKSIQDRNLRVYIQRFLGKSWKYFPELSMHAPPPPHFLLAALLALRKAILGGMELSTAGMGKRKEALNSSHRVVTFSWLLGYEPGIAGLSLCFIVLLPCLI